MKNIHIGKLIKERLKEKADMTVSEFAKRINRTHSTVYDIFDRKSIDIDLLLKISEVLQYDFIKNVYLEQTSSELPPRYYLAVEIDEADLISSKLDKQMYMLSQALKKKGDIITGG